MVLFITNTGMDQTGLVGIILVATLLPHQLRLLQHQTVLTPSFWVAIAPRTTSGIA